MTDSIDIIRKQEGISKLNKPLASLGNSGDTNSNETNLQN